ncbi:MAG: hypothetical protein M1570_17680 [Chloroflexi bacterium]|nr:hypothetical protein [Chloroflexota bacterium]
MVGAIASYAGGWIDALLLRFPTSSSPCQFFRMILTHLVLESLAPIIVVATPDFGTIVVYEATKPWISAA